MVFSIVAMAAATVVISGCTAPVAATAGHIYPDWAPHASSVGCSSEPMNLAVPTEHTWRQLNTRS
jgi:hypothetical protein